MAISNSDLIAKMQKIEKEKQNHKNAERKRVQDIKDRIRRLLDAAIPLRKACYARPINGMELPSLVMTVAKAIKDNGWNEPVLRDASRRKATPIECLTDTRLDSPNIIAGELARRTIAAAIAGKGSEVESLIAGALSGDQADIYSDFLGERTLTTMMKMLVTGDDHIAFLIELNHCVLPTTDSPASTFTGDNESVSIARKTDLESVDGGPPAELLHQLTQQQKGLLSFLWKNRRATRWSELPRDCWRSDTPTDRAIESALERLRDALNRLLQFGCSIEIKGTLIADGTVKLSRNLTRK